MSKAPRRKTGPAVSEPPPPGIVPHAHCIACGRSIAAGQVFCSTACTQTLEAQRRRQRRTSWVLLGFMALLMVVWFILLSRSVR